MVNAQQERAHPEGAAMPAREHPLTHRERLAASTAPIRLPQGDWQRFYRRGTLLTDTLALVWVVFGTQIAWLGNASATFTASPHLRLDYTLVSAAIILLWLLALTINDTRSFRVTGVGLDEYKRIADSSLILFGIFGVASYLFRWEIARGYLLIALPAGLLTLLLTRWLWRRWLGHKRSQGSHSRRVLVLGTSESAARVAHQLQTTPHAGYQVVGVCVDDATGELEDVDVPIVGAIDDYYAALSRCGADTVILASSEHLPPERVRRISWSLEQGRRHLIVAPSLTDIAGPRLHTRPVAGLPLIHVETPRFSAGQRVVKRVSDILVSGLGIVAISPLLLALAIIVKTTSKGPVIFRQKRVGYRGREFTMLKFRSMVIDAEEQLEALRKRREQDMGNEVLFKMADDPRVTRVGRFMRKYSLDELPQLFNVFGGSMSLVGPRPPLQSEVEQYADHVHRRFLVKPGITGLWQVSGRSQLSWDDTVRLDLSYVENWSLMGDLLIMLKTGRAVLSPGKTAV